jgi:RND family efflux transporter MFP subunit
MMPISRYTLLLLLLLLCLPGYAAAEGDGSGRTRIQLVAKRQTSLSSEISARIEKIPFREGDAFKEGDLLVGFDCALLQAQFRKAEAEAEAARNALQVNRKLAAMDSISTLELQQSESKVKEKEAEETAMRVSVFKCDLKAPFSGRVARLSADPHQYVIPGKPLMDILETGALEVRMIVPSNWLAWLKPGGRFSVQIEELRGRSYPARVIRVGARIDPLSRTVSLAGEVVGKHPELLPGMSGWASFRGGK